jgi:anti-sigma regulatory factor (Ser/Thr protein kinase)
LPVLEFQISEARLEKLPDLLSFVENRCSELGLSSTVCYDAKLAVEEIVVNLIQHGYGAESPGPVAVSVERSGAEVVIAISDKAPPFAPDGGTEPALDTGLDERREGGLGLFLVRQVMDELRYETSPDRGNRLQMIKRLDRGGSDGGQT